MARHCTICASEHRDEIDRALVLGESSYAIASRFAVSASAVQRHSKRHVSPSLTAMHSAELADRHASLLDRIEGLILRAEQLFLSAAAEGKFSQSLDALVELRRQLELLGKATGELNDRPQVVVNLMASTEWLELRGAIFQSLSAYPEARAALSGRLLELEGKDT